LKYNLAKSASKAAIGTGWVLIRSVVGPFVHRCVGNYRELWKNGRLDQNAVWGGESGGPKEPCIRWGSDPHGS